MLTPADIEKDLRRRDFRLRLFPRASRRWLGCLLAVFGAPTKRPIKLPPDHHGRPRLDWEDYDFEAAELHDWKITTRRRAVEMYRDTYGNPVFLFILGIVFQVLWYWWTNRDQKTRSREMADLNDLAAAALAIAERAVARADLTAALAAGTPRSAPPPKSAARSKTIRLGLAVTALSFVGLVAGQTWIQEYPALVATLGIIAGGLTILVRFHTTAPIGKP